MELDARTGLGSGAPGRWRPIRAWIARGCSLPQWANVRADEGNVRRALSFQ